MSESLTFPMHRSHPANMVGLSEVLSAIEAEGLVWRITDFEAFGLPGSNVMELECRVAEAGVRGVRLTDDELRTLAAKLHQVINCEVVGYLDGTDVLKSANPALRLEAFDSTEWTIEVSDHARVRVNKAARFLAVDPE